MSEVLTEAHRPAVERLTKDMMKAASMLSKQECRYLVDAYYIMQEDRKRANNQIRHMEGEPNMIISWLAAQSEVLESQVKRTLKKFAEGHAVGQWLVSQYGIGEVITAGLIAHLNMNVHRCERFRLGVSKEKCKSHDPHPECGPHQVEVAGAFYRFAGLDPTVKWGKGQKRPWNAQLKTLTWHAGQCFMKFHRTGLCQHGKYQKILAGKVKDEDEDDFSGVTGQCDHECSEVVQVTFPPKKAGGKEKVKNFNFCRHHMTELVDVGGKSLGKYNGPSNEIVFYGNIYAKRKRYEIHRNETGGNEETAKRQLSEKNYRTNTEAYKHLITGKLPPGQIDARARRFAVKIMLSSLHLVWFWTEFGKLPPRPWTEGVENHKYPRNNPHYQGFAKFIIPPNVERVPGLLEALIEANKT